MAGLKTAAATLTTLAATTASQRGAIKSASSYAGPCGILILINETSARAHFVLHTSDAGSATLADPCVPPNSTMQVYLPYGSTHISIILSAGTGDVSHYPAEQSA